MIIFWKIFIVFSAFAIVNSNSLTTGRQCTRNNEQYYEKQPSHSINCDDPHVNANFVPGCYCKENYVRNTTNACVDRLKYCQPCEEVNTYYTELDDDCETQCSDFEYRGNTCDAEVNMNRKKRSVTVKKRGSCCLCKSGYARHSNGTCISINKCPCKK